MIFNLKISQRLSMIEKGGQHPVQFLMDHLQYHIIAKVGRIIIWKVLYEYAIKKSSNDQQLYHS